MVAETLPLPNGVVAKGDPGSSAAKKSRESDQRRRRRRKQKHRFLDAGDGEGLADATAAGALQQPRDRQLLWAVTTCSIAVSAIQRKREESR
jgi:hypothetical protein